MQFRYVTIWPFEKRIYTRKIRYLLIESIRQCCICVAYNFQVHNNGSCGEPPEISYESIDVHTKSNRPEMQDADFPYYNDNNNDVLRFVSYFFANFCVFRCGNERLVLRDFFVSVLPCIGFYWNMSIVKNILMFEYNYLAVVRKKNWFIIQETIFNGFHQKKNWAANVSTI